ncbi:glycosyltransferase family 2 protein [Cereibacter sp. SYSU M97828]|nr:glycosyltransferase family 2 protein [Cereibacter flavus]
MTKVPLPQGLAKRVSPHGRITAVSMMKDEGPFVLEWVAHHLAVGFTDLVVYTNDCSDGTDTMLMRLEAMGLAHHRVNVIPEGLRPQPSALNHAQDEPIVGESDWVMVFDADEFLSIRHGDGTLDPMIADAKAQGANGIVITWRIFGSGGVQHWSRDPVTEQYLMAAPPDWNKGWGVKTLFQFDPEYWKLGIHRPKMKSKWLETEFPETVKWLNGSGREMESYFKFRGWRSITRTIGYDWAQLNHYAVKSIDSYAIRKFRGNVNNKKDKYNADYWSLQDRNEVRDDTMLRYSAERKRIFDLLLTDPELNRLHFAAVERAETRLAEFKGTPAYDELVAGLLAASQVPISAVEAKPPQARDPEKIAALMSRVEKDTNAKSKAEREKTPAAPAPPAYVHGIDLTEPTDAPWFESHGILMPADPRVFSATGLEQVTTGKLERNLARNLPRLVTGGQRHMEIGGVGFMPVRLSRECPHLVQMVVEPDPARRAFIRRIWARNGLAEGPNLTLTDAPLAGAIAAFRPDSILIADPSGPIAQLHAALAETGLRPKVFHHAVS